MDAFWGPSLALALAPALAPGTSDKGPDKIHFRPQQKNTACFDGSRLHRLHRRIALANGEVMIFAIIYIKRRESRRGAVIINNIKNFPHEKITIPWRGCRTGCSSSTSQRCHSGVVRLEAGDGTWDPTLPIPQAAHGDHVNAGSDDSRVLAV